MSFRNPDEVVSDLADRYQSAKAARAATQAIDAGLERTFFGLLGDGELDGASALISSRSNLSREVENELRCRLDVAVFDRACEELEPDLLHLASDDEIRQVMRDGLNSALRRQAVQDIRDGLFDSGRGLARLVPPEDRIPVNQAIDHVLASEAKKLLNAYPNGERDEEVDGILRRILAMEVMQPVAELRAKSLEAAGLRRGPSAAPSAEEALMFMDLRDAVSDEPSYRAGIVAAGSSCALQLFEAFGKPDCRTREQRLVRTREVLREAALPCEDDVVEGLVRALTYARDEKGLTNLRDGLPQSQQLNLGPVL
jgi:hypothetical protein